MDPEHSAQDVLRCHICKKPLPQLFCALCNTDLCKDCAGDHLLDATKEHKVLPLEKRWCPNLTYPKCPEHIHKKCKNCKICVHSKDHKSHNIVEHFKYIRDFLSRELQELEIYIYPTYKKILDSISMQKNNLRIHSQELSQALDEHRYLCYKEVDTVIEKMKSEINDCDLENLKTLDKQQETIANTIAEILQTIWSIKISLESNDFHHISKFESQVKKFEHLPTELTLSVLSFFPKTINREKLNKVFGSIEKKHVLFHPWKPILDEPKIISTLKAGHSSVRKVICDSDEEIWTIGVDQYIRHSNSHEHLPKPIQTNSKDLPWDIAMEQSGDLLYIDKKERSINIVDVKRSQIKPVIKLQHFTPYSVCVCFFGDLLVIMSCKDRKETKVVRFFGSEEIQSIQWDDKHRPLYSSGNNACISENKNLDICVSDYEDHKVVVVRADGKFKFRYTDEMFRPVAICTDSQSNILTADCGKNRIHILDQNGHRLHYIKDHELPSISGICLDSKDNVFVTTTMSGEVKKIKYYK